MSFYSQQFSASFSPQTIYGALDPWAVFIAGQVRIDSAGLLASLLLEYDWVDSNGAQSKQITVALGTVGISPPFTFPVFSAGNQYLTMKGTVTGSATFTVQYGVVYF